MKPNRNKAIRSLLVAGILPVLAFTLIEEWYGVVWGLVAGMIFGVGELSYEWVTERKISSVTLFGNGMLLALGAVSLITQEGIWFKLQPAIVETGFAALLMGSVFLKKPLLVMMSEKQGLFERVPTEAHSALKAKFSGLTFRLGLFFLAHAGLATWAALHWSTAAWAWLKGLGFTASLVVYFVLEMLWMRRGKKSPPAST